jgi:CheY-like chemotaxis protein
MSISDNSTISSRANFKENVPSCAAGMKKGEKFSILIAEDNRVNLFMLRKLMKENDRYDIDLAVDGTEAIKYIENKHYDIIFLDNQMPEKTGVQVAQYVRQANLASVIVFQSTDQLEHLRKECASLDVYDFLPKIHRLTQIDAVVSKIESQAFENHKESLNS